MKAIEGNMTQKDYWAIPCFQAVRGKVPLES